jgi:NAD(P)-dependent dehydrogenase (short-subunit alcohol dehydrogenase family)
MTRCIIITGAGRGIGRATAQRFANSGDHLVLMDRKFDNDVDELEQTARAAGGSVIAQTGDITVAQDVAALISTALEMHGRLDVLVNNAGILLSRETTQTTMDEWNRVIAVNLTGTWACIHAALPTMLAQKSGRIINVSSELGLIGFPTYAAYCASKGGVIAMTKAIAKEVAQHGVLVNSVAPGPIETHMLKYDTIEFNDETREQLPIKRFGQPDEIAAVIEFLAGPGGTYMVGQIVSPNGGAAI